MRQKSSQQQKKKGKGKPELKNVIYKALFTTKGGKNGCIETARYSNGDGPAEENFILRPVIRAL